MSSLREQILAQVLTNLRTVSGLSSSNCLRTRIKPVEESDYPFVSIEPVSDVPDAKVIGRVYWDLTIKIKIYHKGTVPDQVADTLLTAIKDKMLEDRSVNNLAADVFPGPVVWDFTLGNKDCVEIESNFLINYIEQG